MSASTNSWSWKRTTPRLRLERGERVVGDLRLRRAHRRDQRRLARVREADERGVGQQLELEPQPALLAVLALLGERRRPARVRQEAGVAPAAPAAVGREPAVAVVHEVGEQLAVAIAHDGALGHVDDEVVAARAVALACPCRACPTSPAGADGRGTRAATRRCGRPAARRRRPCRRRRRRVRPSATCASRRNDDAPAPPSPPRTLSWASSTKLDMTGQGYGFTQIGAVRTAGRAMARAIDPREARIVPDRLSLPPWGVARGRTADSRPRNRDRTGLSRRGLRPARGDARRGRARSRTAYADVRRGRHPPGPPRAGHRLGRHPAPARRPRHRRLAPVLRPARPRDRRPAATSGRLAVDDDDHTPLVVDWRAPVAEPFYRATADRAHGRRAAPPPHHPARAARSSASTTRCSTSDAVDDGRAARSPARARCSPRSSATAPAAWATSSPPSRPSRTRRSAPTLPGVAGRGGRSRHRQDRGRAAPRRVPPLHAPPPARRRRACCSSGRARCSCATSSRCCRRSASRTCSSRRSPGLKPRLRTVRAEAPDGRRGQGRRPDGDGRGQRAVADRERPLRATSSSLIDGLRLRLSPARLPHA